MRRLDAPWPIAMRPSSTVDRYRILRRLGYGQEGTVYLVREVGTGATRAMKLYWANSPTDYLRIAAIAGRFEALKDTGVVIRYYHSGEFVTPAGDAHPYLVFEYVGDTILDDLLRSKRRRRAHGVYDDARLLRSLISKVAALHSVEVAAGDFERGRNVALTPEGEAVFVDLLTGFRGAPSRDFGGDHRMLLQIARLLRAQDRSNDAINQVARLLRSACQALPSRRTLPALCNEMDARWSAEPWRRDSRASSLR